MNIEHCPLDDDIFVLFNSAEHLKRLHSFLNSCHLNISFIIENEKDNRMSFLDANIIRKRDKFTTTVYRNQLLAELIPILTLSYHPVTKLACYIYYYIARCFRICSDWTKFHLELVKLLDLFKNSSYPKNDCFKVFLDNKYSIREKVITMPKKILFLVLPYHGPLSL